MLFLSTFNISSDFYPGCWIVTCQFNCHSFGDYWYFFPLAAFNIIPLLWFLHFHSDLLRCTLFLCIMLFQWILENYQSCLWILLLPHYLSSFWNSNLQLHPLCLLLFVLRFPYSFPSFYATIWIISTDMCGSSLIVWWV